MVAKAKGKYIAPSEGEHKLIGAYLKTDFIPYLKTLKASATDGDDLEFLITVIEILCESWRVAQGMMAEKLELSSHSVVSRACDELNKYLVTFCSKEHLTVPIQVFFSHLNSTDEIKRFRCHLACSVGKLEEDRRGRRLWCSHNIVPFDVAKGRDVQLEQFRGKLKEEAEKHLEEKLYGRGLDDYRALRLEIGQVKEAHQERGQRVSDAADHNREWQDFDHTKLEQPESVYILTSETGSGKTTFLRHLQCTLINNTDLIPLFFEASEMNQMSFKKRNAASFLNAIGQNCCGYLSGGGEQEFLKIHQDKIVFLVDGLDQIQGAGTEYSLLIDELLGVINNELIISSRPFAAIDKERNSDISFLRLEPFNEEDMRGYFGEKYDRAKELCKTCSGLLYTPMLAHMARCLIEEERDRDVTCRTDLYEEFIDGIFEHSRDRLKLSEEQLVQARFAYGETSFRAIANKEPHIQRIPFEFAVDCKNAAVDIDYLFKLGIADSIVNTSQRIKRFMYFSHQTFQAYLAAEYVGQSESRIEQVISEKWNPKWKEVIKFLVGIKGQVIIERILAEKDNPIHSKLFLAAEMVPETKIREVLRNSIYQELEELAGHPIYSLDAEDGLMYVNQATTINRLMKNLNSKEENVVKRAIEALGRLAGRADAEIVARIADKLDDGNSWIRHAAIEALVRLEDKVGVEIVEMLVAKLDNGNANSVCLAIDVLGRLKNKVNDEIIEKIVRKLDDDYKGIVQSAINALGGFKGKVDVEAIGRLLEELDHEDAEVRYDVMHALEGLRDTVDDGIVRRLEDRLESADQLIVCRAMEALGHLKDKVGIRTIEKVASRLDDESTGIELAAISALGALGDAVGVENVRKIANKLNDNTSVVLSALEALAKFKESVDPQIIERIASRLEDDNPKIFLFATFALERLQDKVGIRIMSMICNRLDDRNERIVCLAIEALAGFKDKIDGKSIEMIASKLSEDNEEIVSSAIEALGRLSDMVDVETVADIVNKIYDTDDGRFLCTAVRALGELRDKVDARAVRMLLYLSRDLTYDVLKLLYQGGKMECYGE